MKTKVSVNGFGRIGRLALRAALDHPQLEIVAVNDLAPTESLAYLFTHDSTHGPFRGEVAVVGDALLINGHTVRCFAEKEPAKLPWKALGVDMVLECTGLFLKHDTADDHLEAGAKRVVLSAPAKTPDITTLVMGVNEKDYDPARDTVVSNASCTTNALAPLVKVLLENFGVEEGLMTTIHAATATQHVVDGVSAKNPRLGRSALQNIIPATTGAAAAVARCIPAVAGKLTGMAFRVPTADVSAVDLTVRLTKATDMAGINAAMKTAAEGDLKGILGYTEDPVVSSDFIGCPLSSIYDAGAGIQLNSNFFKLISWYDNEWGYTQRLIDLMAYMISREA